MSVSTVDRERQLRQAEELLFAGAERLGVGKGLFVGRFVSDWVMPYPRTRDECREEVDRAVAEAQRFVSQAVDPAVIDRQADIPLEVIDGLRRLGIMGMTAPVELGGKGFSQLDYCRVMEVIGSRCASTSIFVNVHHSIGMRALLLFGTDAQKRRWLPNLIRGEQLAAFALTEPEAGSDASNVQTSATPSPDGSHYILNGQKRYITNGGIAHVLTVMARTPVPGRTDTAITAFLVTPDMPGFEVVEARMEKLGIRGTVTSRLAFHDMRVPKENILGTPGEGLKVALTVLDFGRTTFGACCTGAAKTCLRLAVEYANRRRQFGRTLGEFELVKKKVANMAADIYAMEAMTAVTASLIDRGLEDYMVETAMLKVFATEALWTIVNDAFQIYGGAAYFTDQPLERMLRDARINQIGEGANDVLRSFIALVGMRGPGEELRGVWDALHHPWAERRKVWAFGRQRVAATVQSPAVPVRSVPLRAVAHRLGKLIRQFDHAVHRCLIRHREEIVERQYVQERIAEAAIDLYASACVLSRLDSELQERADHDLRDEAGVHVAAELFLQSAARRVVRRLSSLRHNDDTAITRAAEWALQNGHDLGRSDDVQVT